MSFTATMTTLFSHPRFDATRWAVLGLAVLLNGCISAKGIAPRRSRWRKTSWH